MTRPWLVGALVVGLSGLSLPLGAQPLGTQPKASKKGPPKAACSAARSAIDTTARSIAAGLGRAPDGTLVASAALTATRRHPAPRR